MINKDRTSSTRLFKYGIPFPFLIAFIVLFNIRTEAKIGVPAPENQLVTHSTLSARTYRITKTTSDVELEALAKTIKEENGSLTLNKLQRNEAGEIIELALEYRLGPDHFVTGSYAEATGISTVYFGVNKEGGIFVSTIKDSDSDSKPGRSTFNLSGGSANGKAHALGVSTGIPSFEAMPTVVMDGKEVPHATLHYATSEEIPHIKVLKDSYATGKYGKELKNGAIEITTKKPWSTSVGLMPTHPEKTSAVSFYDQIATANQPDIDKALIIIDGKESSKEVLEQIMSDEIESTTSFKGQEALDKYGEKAKDGVIEIRPYNGDAKRPVKHPLVIIDGEVSSKSVLKELDPDRIKAMHVLKGADALQKYGNRAKDGAIEITTVKD